MNDTARERILGRLRKAVGQERELPAVPPPPEAPPLGRADRIERLQALMTAMRSEVHLVPRDGWMEKLKAILEEKGVSQMIYAPGTPVGDAVAAAWTEGGGGLPALRPYDQAVESFKKELFAIDAGITGTVGAVAETGALILWPDEKEPRLISLVPAVHIAVLDADQIYDTLDEAVEKGGWAEGMPTNALLVSGPSKTADIELVLAFGVHGPKALVVLVLT